MNRRDFIKNIGLSGLGLGILSKSSIAEYSSRQISLGYSNSIDINIPNWDLILRDGFQKAFYNIPTSYKDRKFNSLEDGLSAVNYYDLPVKIENDIRSGLYDILLIRGYCIVNSHIFSHIQYYGYDTDNLEYIKSRFVTYIHNFDLFERIYSRSNAGRFGTNLFVEVLRAK